MQNILRWKKSERGSSHVPYGLDPRLQYGLYVLWFDLPAVPCSYNVNNYAFISFVFVFIFIFMTVAIQYMNVINYFYCTEH